MEIVSQAMSELERGSRSRLREPIAPPLAAVLASAALLAIAAPARAVDRAASSPPGGAAAGAPLADAAEAGRRSAVRELLAQGIDVNAPQPDGMTALHWAAYSDDAELVTRLLAAGARADARNRYDVTPLSLACRNGNAAIVEALLAAGADPNARLRDGQTPLMTAARTGRIGPVRALLEAGADVDAREGRGQTALMWAAAEGQVEVVDALLRAGADFRTPLASGFTPLFFAAREGKIGVVRRLVEAGADVNAAMEPRRRARRGPQKGMTALLLAVENAHFELALELVEAGADPDDQRAGYTALHALSWVRKPNLGDGLDGLPPPEGSGRVGSLEFARRIVALGADVNARLERGSTSRGRLSRKGATPFFLAAVTADAPLMRTLVDLGADPRLTNADGSTPLMAAAGVGVTAPGEVAGTEPEVLEAIALCIELGGDVNAVDRNGETAMHGAAYRSHPEVVEYLVKEGARIEIWNRPDRWGWTPLTIAYGYRLGNFKPSPPTIAALKRVMLAVGVKPPKPRPPGKHGEDY